LDYFKPLETYLDEELKKAEEMIGWETKYKEFYREGERYEDEATQFLKDLDPIYLREANAQMVTRWQSITNITTEHSQEEVSPFQLLCIHSLKSKRRMLF
jgi:hypothetical protein